ncbi:substrate-binding domain-containing protein [Nakamurella flavida]|uniref:Substrate-binding domain-containing protein n=1 Tax=Nakamurella flavida TaxID=363630 RepID=A0A938YD81_9ACTN|nr:substrate-binding domain-containing protein [Nakamurella flavida]MBM9475521.1 substrate-binding domain-containing protein [Nakamurella flavida]MDP9778204.1 ribose transport system substrate-binding protein [Nakamurella flavida]
MSVRPTRSLGALFALTAVSAVLVAGCTSNTAPAPSTSSAAAAAGSTAAAATGSSAAPASGEPVVIGFSAPAADHGWMGAITKAAVAEAAKYPEVELRQAEATNDVNLQISQIETFINDGVDAIVLLPFDGAALTEVATKAMDAGIPVINVDREFTSPLAARATVLGDNYGMGVSAGSYICSQVGDKPDAVIAEVAGIDSLPLTQDRSKGFADALSDCGLSVTNRVAADFTVQGGETATSNLLQAAPKIDALWNHDDDQGVGVLAAIENAGRSELLVVGGAGSKNMMDLIQGGDSVVKATVIYPSTQAADGIKLARLIVQNANLGDLQSAGVPRTIQLFAPVVTAENVAEYLPNAFES